MGGSQEKLIQPPSPPKYNENRFSDLFWIEDDSPVGSAHACRYRVPARFLEWKNKDGERAKITILFSNGHNEDLSDASSTVGVLQNLLRVNFLIFDYCGYGLHANTQGQRSPFGTEKERFTEAMFEEVLYIALRWLTTVQKIPRAQILLMGKGFGTGPVISVASNLVLSAQEARRIKNKEKAKGQPEEPLTWEHQGVAGVILQAPMLSVNKAIEDSDESISLHKPDAFLNIKKIGLLECPVFMAHGTSDRIICFKHAQKLRKKLDARSKSPRGNVFIEAANVGHMELGVDDDFLEALMGFVNGLSGNSKQVMLSDSKEVRPSYFNTPEEILKNEFFTEIGLDHLATEFITQGYTDLHSIIYEINEDVLLAMGIAEDARPKILEQIQKKKQVEGTSSPARVYTSIGSISSIGSLGDSNSSDTNRENNQNASNQPNQGTIAIPKRPKTALPRSRTDASGANSRVKHLSLDDSLAKLSAANIQNLSAPNSVQSRRENFSQQKTGHVLHLNSARTVLGLASARETTTAGLGVSLDTAASSSTHNSPHHHHAHDGGHHSPSSVLASLSPRSRFLHIQKERDKERERESSQLKRDQIFLNAILERNEIFEKCSGYVQDKENPKTEEPVVYFSFKDTTTFHDLNSTLQRISALSHANVAVPKHVCVYPQEMVVTFPQHYGSYQAFEAIYHPFIDEFVLLKLVQDVANGLHYLHSQTPPIPLCSLSIHSVYIDYNGAVLSDWGAHISQKVADLPPECKGSRYADIYLFGLFILKVGKMLYARKEEIDGQTTFLVQMNPLISSCLNPNPSLRWTIDKVSEILDEIVNHFNVFFPPLKDSFAELQSRLTDQSKQTREKRRFQFPNKSSRLSAADGGDKLRKESKSGRDNKKRESAQMIHPDISTPNLSPDKLSQPKDSRSSSPNLRRIKSETEVPDAQPASPEPEPTSGGGKTARKITRSGTTGGTAGGNSGGSHGRRSASPSAGCGSGDSLTESPRSGGRGKDGDGKS